jgi:hypothetical protein
MSQTELQQELERFSGQFADRLVQVMEPLVESSDSAIRRTALRRQLNYVAGLFDIVSAPEPEVNLLDMVAFVKLTRSTLERYWIPNVFGEAGEPMSAAWAAFDGEISTVARRFVGPSQKAEIDALVESWLIDHPDQRNVEAVRLSGFAVRAGELAENEARRARGLLASVRSATVSADQALLLAERALFMAHRLPFILRMHVRVVVSDLAKDAVLACRSFLRKWALPSLAIAGTIVVVKIALRAR